MNLLKREENDLIGVYPVLFNHELIKEYKEKEIKKIPIGERVWYLKTSIFKKVVFEEGKIEPGFLNLGSSFQKSLNAYKYANNFHMLRPVSFDSLKIGGLKSEESILDMYISNDFPVIAKEVDYPKIIKLWKTDKKIEYLLFFQNEFSRNLPYQNDCYILEEIISVPETLYNLQLLINGQVDQLVNADLSEQSNLVSIPEEPVDRFSLGDIKRAVEAGISSIPIDNVEKEITERAAVLRKIIEKK